MKTPRTLTASCFCIGVALSGVSQAVSAQQSTRMSVDQMNTMSSTSPDVGIAYWIPDNGEMGGYVIFNTSNSKTRAQVVQELQEAKADRAWATRQGEETGYVTNKMISSETRVHVLQELQEAKANRDWAALQREAAGS